MEGEKYFIKLMLIIGLCVFSMQVSLGQIDHTNRLYEAYARGKMDVWIEVLQEFEANNSLSTNEDKLELINLYYGYAAWLISLDRTEEAEKYIDKPEDLLDEILDEEPEHATAMAYKGAFIAFEIAVSNLKAIYLGRTSMGYIEDALEADPTNIQANIEMANSRFYMPDMFGGDKLESIKYYKEAAKQMEANNMVENNWLYLNVMTALGMAYEATEQIMHAKLCYEKILVVKPNFMWVGEELYPDMLKRHNL